MKLTIIQHPRMRDISIGDEVYCAQNHLFASVVDTFPAAVCVRLGVLSFEQQITIAVAAQLWPADAIENLSVCRYCRSREDLCDATMTGVPFRVCVRCCEQATAWPEEPSSETRA